MSTGGQTLYTAYMIRHARRHVRSYKYAAQGVRYTLLTQVNIWVQIIATVATLLLASVLRLPVEQFLILILTIGFVVVTELLNTAIEEMTNFVSPQQHEHAGLIKDIAAGAVLVAALTAALVGILLFAPPLWTIAGDIVSK